MVEIPSNVVLIEEFGKIFDGFSIGSNDLTRNLPLVLIVIQQRFPIFLMSAIPPFLP